MRARSARPSLPQTAAPYLSIPGRVAFYGWMNVDFVLWKSAPEPEAVRAVADVVPQRMRANANKLSVIHVMYAGCGLPGHEARVELRAIGARWRDAIACIGLVVEGGGLWQSAWRGVLTGLIALSPARRTVCVVPTLKEVADWLPPHHLAKTGIALERHELLRVLQAVRDEQT